MSSHAWAIVLAGGEGTRIQSLIRRCLGFSCPKQYFTFCGKRSMLEHTIERAVRLVGNERVVTIIGRDHQRHLKHMKIPGLIIEQPVSRGTGAGVFLPATYILSQDPEATVLIFPSDHFIFPRADFLKQVEAARHWTDRLAHRIILMAAVPDLPETDYGWVEPGDPLSEADAAGHPLVREVRAFREKPGAEEARKCFDRGHLWNTMIIAAKLRALWSVAARLIPEMVEQFDALHRLLLSEGAAGTLEAQGALSRLYDLIPTFDFSSALLSRAAGDMAVMPLQGVLWSDWGRPERVFSSLRKIGRKPSFLEHARRWRRTRSHSVKL